MVNYSPKRCICIIKVILFLRSSAFGLCYAKIFFMHEITKRQFDAFCYSRQPVIRILVQELQWFATANKKILAVITFDNTDSDYGFAVFGRDTRKIFRCIDCCVSCPTLDDAREKLAEKMDFYANDGEEFYSQGDEKSAPNDIFIPTVPEDGMHDYFKSLMNDPEHEGARNLIREMIFTYIETDKNYIKEFQTNGFDARLWELYLYAYLYNAGFEFNKGKVSPDYHVSYYWDECFIEAVTVNPGGNPLRPDPSPPESEEEVLHLRENYLPIKYGSSLYSKLQKKYWEMDHVKGKPLIIAIHDFHMVGSMLWSRTALADYLYGVRVVEEVDKDGKSVYKNIKLTSHVWEDKTIPSGFFNQPDAENISAVLFTNAATIAKFNRMGKLAGLGSQNIKMIREGCLFNPDPEVFVPLKFSVDVDSPEYEESWSDSLIMYHNPNAKYPVGEGFEEISHLMYDYEKEEYIGKIQPYSVLNSRTWIIRPKKD